MTDRATADELRAFVERYERLDAEKADIADGQKEVMAEAEARGYDVKALRQIIALRKRTPDQIAEEEAVLAMAYRIEKLEEKLEAMNYVSYDASRLISASRTERKLTETVKTLTWIAKGKFLFAHDTMVKGLSEATQSVIRRANDTLRRIKAIEEIEKDMTE